MSAPAPAAGPRCVVTLTVAQAATLDPAQLDAPCPLCGVPMHAHVETQRATPGASVSAPPPAAPAPAPAPGLHCEVPSFEAHALWNPTGDLFSVRPVDLLRKLYDLLGSALRWYVASHLLSPERCYRPAGQKGKWAWEETQLYFTAHRMSRNDDGNSTRTLQGAALTQASLDALLASPQGSQLEAEAERAATDPVENLAVSLDDYFQLRISLDCDKLLRHISHRHKYYGKVAAKAALHLFYLRNVVFHRAFLAEGGEQEIHEYCVRAVMVFHNLVDDVFKFRPECDLLRSKLQFQDQVAEYREHMRHTKTALLFWRKLLPARFPASQLSATTLAGSADERVAAIVTPTDLDAFLKEVARDDLWARTQYDVALLFSTRFTAPIPLVRAAQPTAAPVKASTNVKSAFGLHRPVGRWSWKTPDMAEQTQGSGPSAAASGAGSSTSSGSDNAHSTRRFVRTARGASHRSEWTLSDPLGVSHADMLWRMIDAFCVLVQELLFAHVWSNGGPELQQCLIERKTGVIQKLKSLSLEGCLPLLDVLIRERKDQDDAEMLQALEVQLGVPANAQNLRFYDPGLLIHSLKQLLRATGMHASIDGQFVMQALNALLGVRDMLSHQEWIDAPRAADIQIVETQLRDVVRCLTYVHGVLRPFLLPAEQYLSAEQWMERRVAGRLLLALRRCTTSGGDAPGAAPSAYGRFRSSQRASWRDYQKQTQSLSALSRRILDALHSTATPPPSAAHRAVALALMQRFQWTLPKRAGAGASTHSNAFALLDIGSDDEDEE